MGSGLVPVAPGTSGSLAALLAGWAIWNLWGVPGLLCALILLMPLACWACHITLQREPADKDPGWIVVDEWLGQWLCLLMVSGVVALDASWFAACFIVFRILDIAKPWPIDLAERTGPPWWAIQADDLLAGAIGGAALAGVALYL
ncbi:MAG: phosphatidylglycerophosphatase A [Mariprofundaceae bacterium]